MSFEMQFSSELTEKRYQRLRLEPTDYQEVIEVKTFEEFRKEVQRILQVKMCEDNRVCTFAHYIFDDNEDMGSCNVENVEKYQYDDLVGFFVKLPSVVRIKGAGMKFESDEGTAVCIIVCDFK